MNEDETTLRDQAAAWEKVIELCLSLGANSKHGSSGVSMVLNFIQEIHGQAETYRLMKKFIRNEKQLRGKQ